MEDKNKKKDGIVIINKFKENETIDVRALLENAFKIYYDMQVNKNKVS